MSAVELSPPEVHLDPEAREYLLAVLSQHPGRVLRIRHEGYG